MPAPYGGVHEFHFVSRDQPELVSGIESQLNASLRQRDAVRSKTVFNEGDWSALFHYVKNTTAELGELHDELWDVGVRSDYDTEGQVYKDSSGRAFGPRRHSPDFGAICRLKADQKPLELLKSIGDEFGASVEDGPFVGGSQLLRASKLLIQLGAGSEEEIRGLVEALHGFPGVADQPFEQGLYFPDGASA